VKNGTRLVYEEECNHNKGSNDLLKSKINSSESIRLI